MRHYTHLENDGLTPSRAKGAQNRSTSVSKMAVALALYQPDIAQNTGTLLRLGACLDTPIHNIHPTGVTHGAIGSALIERVEARSGNLFSG